MRREYGVWLAAVALASLLCCGCGGVLAETEKDGQLERLRVGTTTKWSSYDRNPTKKDESIIMLKKESTF
jgi:hypothetical protein